MVSIRLLAEELRRELRRVSWALGSSLALRKAGFTVEKPPYMTGDVTWVDYCEDDVLARDGRVVRYRRDYSKVWTIPVNHWYGSVQYNPLTNRVLITEQGRVFEVDADTGAFIRQLTTIGGRSLSGEWLTASYHPNRLGDGDTLVVTVTTKHYAAIVNWNGNVINEYGEWGVSGIDDAHLNSPRCSVGSGGDVRYFYIADSLNHRILEIRSNKTLNRKVIFPRPGFIGTNPTIYMPVSAEYPTYQPTMIFADSIGSPISWLPFSSNAVAISWDMRRVLVNMHFTVWEFYLHDLENRVFPLTFPVLVGESLSAGESRGPPWSPATVSAYTPPVYTFPWEKARVYAKSTQDATLTVLIAKPAYVHEWGWFGGWEAYDSTSLTANTFKYLDLESGVFGFLVNMGSVGGKVDLWVNLR